MLRWPQVCRGPLQRKQPKLRGHKKYINTRVLQSGSAVCRTLTFIYHIPDAKIYHILYIVYHITMVHRILESFCLCGLLGPRAGVPRGALPQASQHWHRRVDGGRLRLSSRLQRVTLAEQWARGRIYIYIYVSKIHAYYMYKYVYVCVYVYIYTHMH